MASKVEGHPFYPKDLKLEGYVPNVKGHIELLVVFFGVLLLSLLGLWVIMAFRDHLKGRLGLKIKISWFFMCGLIHMVLEGYFAVYHKTLKEDKSYLGEMWKEYSKGDSRYISADTFTVCMETITFAIDGPLAFIATYAFLSNSSYRYVAQLVLSVCQLYGDVLYMSIEWKDGFTHGPYGHPLYFWFYFMCLNTFWIIIPLVLVIESWRELSKAQSSSDDASYSSSANSRKLK